MSSLPREVALNGWDGYDRSSQSRFLESRELKTPKQPDNSTAIFPLDSNMPNKRAKKKTCISRFGKPLRQLQSNEGMNALLERCTNSRQRIHHFSLTETTAQRVSIISPLFHDHSIGHRRLDNLIVLLELDPTHPRIIVSHYSIVVRQVAKVVACTQVTTSIE